MSQIEGQKNTKKSPMKWTFFEFSYQKRYMKQALTVLNR